MKVASTSTLGFPRMGPNRNLKFALEKHWKGLLTESEIKNVAKEVEEMAWDLQRAAGIDHIPVGDHYLYDGILSWIEYLGIVPQRFQNMKSGTARMFAMARGVDGATALSKKNDS
jgi:5-methyltetrahydropteroyltriglutamate--homocysteine methyltransferase